MTNQNHARMTWRGGGGALFCPLHCLHGVLVGNGPNPADRRGHPQFAVPLSPEEQREELERQKRKVMEAAEQHVRGCWLSGCWLTMQPQHVWSQHNIEAAVAGGSHWKARSPMRLHATPWDSMRPHAALPSRPDRCDEARDGGRAADGAGAGARVAAERVVAADVLLLLAAGKGAWALLGPVLGCKSMDNVPFLGAGSSLMHRGALLISSLWPCAAHRTAGALRAARKPAGRDGRSRAAGHRGRCHGAAHLRRPVRRLDAASAPSAVTNASGDLAESPALSLHPPSPPTRWWINAACLKVASMFRGAPQPALRPVLPLAHAAASTPWPLPVLGCLLPPAPQPAAARPIHSPSALGCTASSLAVPFPVTCWQAAQGVIHPTL